MSELEGFEKTSFTADGKTRDVYTIGSGPAVIVIAEMPGITHEVADFVRRLPPLGLTAVLPHLFGEVPQPMSVGSALKSIGPACVSREFNVWATGRTSPIISWLRALGRHAHTECGGPGIGAVGMCFTGGFALAMMVDDIMLAPVLSQPSLPFGLTKKHKADVGLSPGDFAKVKQRCEADPDLCLLGLRFTGDFMAPGERFATLRKELGDNFVGVELDSSKGNPYNHPKAAHSVLTTHLQDREGTPTRAALDQVLDLFTRKLVTAG